MTRTVVDRLTMTAAAAAIAAGTAVVLLTPVPTVLGSAVPAMASCSTYDGSAPGQAFPCYWPGEYSLVMPVCTTYEVALSDAAHAQGNDVRLACDDLESQAGR